MTNMARLFAGAVSFAALAHALPALAQDAAPATEAANRQGLGDIVVTAEKRETNVQKTPLALAVFDGAALRAHGNTDLRSLQNIAPSLQMGMYGTNTLVTLRGVSSRDYTEIGDPAVTISVDNFYLQRAAALNASLFDIERVEVVMGPQGTLYGRNATGGAVNISSVKPKLGVFSGFGTIEYGNYDSLRAEAAVNIPIGDTIAVRASAMSSNHDGYSTNSGVRQNGDDDDSKGARIHVLWKPTSRLSVLATGEYTHTGGVGPVGEGIPYVYSASGAVDHDFPNIASKSSWALNTAGSLDINTRSIRGEVDYDLDFMKISYLGGYRKFIYHRVNDADGYSGTTQASSVTFPQNENEDSQNHELRFTSTGTGPFTWQGGLYYFKEDNALFSQFGYVNTTPANLFRTFSYRVAADSKAAFAQAGYNLTESLKIEGGVRYNDDKKSRVGYNIVNGVFTAQNSRTHNHKVTYHAGIDYQVTTRNLLYAKFDTGYKAGGFTDLAPYGPETITAYEVGSKNRFLGDLLQINLSGFYYDWKNLQVSQYRADGRSLILNAGKAENYGGEAQIVATPTRADRVDLSIDYLHARYKNFAVGENGVNVQYNGNTLPQSPSWSLVGGYQHGFELPIGILTARVQTHFQTKSYFDYRNYDSGTQKSFTKTDLTLDFEPSKAPWSLLLFVRNVENKRVITEATEYGTGLDYLYQYAEPRTFGGRLTYRF